jgi:C4-dicarboxylate transporter, DctM subunit
VIAGEPFLVLGPAAIWFFGIVLACYALFGKPLFAVMGSVAILFYLTADPQLDLTLIFTQMAQIVDQSVFVTIPLFVLAGMLLAESQAPVRLVNVARALFGWMPGGLAVEAVVTCAFFTAFTGASGVTIVALGGLLYPMLLAEKYPEKFSLGLLTTGGSLGLLFPPSLPIIVYALIAGPLTQNRVDVDRLFIAGVIPGALLVIVLSAYAVFVSVRAGVPRHAFDVGAAVRSLRGAAWELPIPLIVIGGIYSGLITAIEASAVVAFYALLVEVVIYRDIRVRDLPAVMRKTAELVGAIVVILGMALALSNYFIDEEIPQQLLRAMETRITSPLTFLLVLNVFLLVVGCLLDIFSATLVVVPLIAPFAARFGIDPIHLGIIFLTNLEIGFLTPPVGMNLFLSSLRFRRPITEVTRVSLPFIGILLLCLLVITYVPWLSTVLVQLIKPVK